MNTDEHHHLYIQQKALRQMSLEGKSPRSGTSSTLLKLHTKVRSFSEDLSSLRLPCAPRTLDSTDVRESLDDVSVLAHAKLIRNFNREAIQMERRLASLARRCYLNTSVSKRRWQMYANDDISDDHPVKEGCDDEDAEKDELECETAREDEIDSSFFSREEEMEEDEEEVADGIELKSQRPSSAPPRLQCDARCWSMLTRRRSLLCERDRVQSEPIAHVFQEVTTTSKCPHSVEELIAKKSSLKRVPLEKAVTNVQPCQGIPEAPPLPDHWTFPRAQQHLLTAAMLRGARRIINLAAPAVADEDEAGRDDGEADRDGAAIDEVVEGRTRADAVEETTGEDWCSVCFCPFDDSMEGRKFIIPGNQQNKICYGCMKMHTTLAIVENAIPIKSPFDKKAIIPYGQVLSLIELCEESHDLRTKYERFRALRKNPDARDCPACGFVQLGNPRSPEMECEKCELQFCFDHSLLHKGKSCRRYTLENPMSNLGSKVYKFFRTKKCPSCLQAVERNGGCEHMTCRCGKSFCWRCGRAYANNTYYHKKKIFFRPQEWQEVCHSKALWSLRVLCTVGVVAAVGPAIAVSPIALAVFGFVRLHKTYNLVERHERWKRERARRKALTREQRTREAREARESTVRNGNKCAHYFPLAAGHPNRCLFCGVHRTHL